jgi:hypothetical protein
MDPELRIAVRNEAQMVRQEEAEMNLETKAGVCGQLKCHEQAWAMVC